MSQPRSFLSLQRSLKQHRVLILVLLIGAMTWIGVFSRASTDFLSSGSRPLRSGWGGVGEFDIFGLTLHYEFEGWADYDYYYQSWGQKFVNGSMPYTEGFNNTRIDGVDYNTPFFLPPLFLYLCGLGVLMGPVGIGFLISLLGYATAFPVYGIAKRLSENETVGAVSAATYLFNPLVLYHTTYQWLNPAPFVFFVVLSYYLLIQQRRVSGALAMATAILFKQIAAFFALPMLGYLLRPSPRDISPESEPPRDSKGRLLSDTLDLAGFLKMGAIVVAYMVLWSFPYILDPSNYLYYILQRPGGVFYDSVTALPSYNQPITFTVLLIVFGAPEWLAQIFNQGIYYTIFLLPGFLGALALCLFEKKDDRNLEGYWRRILFFTLLLAFWLHIFSPRGIYKYYCVALMPFISILPTSSMLRKTAGKIKVSLPMIVGPALFGFSILLPSRNIYLLVLLLFFIVYVSHKQFSLVYGMAEKQVNKLKSRLRR